MDKKTVALVYVDSYDYDKVKAAIKVGLDLIGGVEKYINSGESVLLKPNMLTREPIIVYLVDTGLLYSVICIIVVVVLVYFAVCVLLRQN